MCRLMYLAACTLFLAVPLWAQHGGGHAGGGHGGSAGHAGFSGGGGGHISGGIHSGVTHSAPGISRGFAHAPSFAQRGMSRAPFVNRTSRGLRIRTFASRNNCFGCRGRYIYPYAYGGFYDPYWWWDSGSDDQSYDEDYQRAGEMNQQSLEEQQMRRQQEQQEEENDPRTGNRDLYTRSPEPVSEPLQPATLLVFRDQHKQEVRNYAIVGPTLWSFGPRTEKIPLSDLDLTATAKANDERGLTFHIPAANEAQ